MYATELVKDRAGLTSVLAVYLPPVPEEVIAEDLFRRVFVIQHLSEEKSHFLCRRVELHCFSCNNIHIYLLNPHLCKKARKQQFVLCLYHFLWVQSKNQCLFLPTTEKARNNLLKHHKLAQYLQRTGFTLSLKSL